MIQPHLPNPNIADNRILRALPQATRDRIRPHLEPARLVAGQVIYHPENRITHSYFITRGLVSLVKTMSDGRTVEIGAIGTEGVTGPDALFGIQDAILECIVQVPGSALNIRPETLKAEMAQCDVLASLLERFVQMIISQIAQTAACNRLHSLEERCCRWLLTAHDSARSDSFSPLTSFSR
jgi:CRP-like cAMP-binding protein